MFWSVFYLYRIQRDDTKLCSWLFRRILHEIVFILNNTQRIISPMMLAERILCAVWLGQFFPKRSQYTPHSLPTRARYNTLKRKGRQDDSPEIQWRRWRQASHQDCHPDDLSVSVNVFCEFKVRSPLPSHVQCGAVITRSIFSQFLPKYIP